MVFLEPLLDLPILRQSSTSLDSTSASISKRSGVTVDSRSESWTLSGMSEITNNSSYRIAQGHYEKIR